MIPELGNFALILAMLLALIQGTLPLIGATRGIPTWIAIARPVVQGQFVFIAIAFGCLAYSFVNNDFRYSMLHPIPILSYRFILDLQQLGDHMKVRYCYGYSCYQAGPLQSVYLVSNYLMIWLQGF